MTSEKDAKTLVIPEYLIEKILPSGEVHIFGGPSGVGKTRVLLQMLVNWMNGQPIWGHESHPVPFVYVPADRTLASFHRTLDNLGIDKKSIPLFDALEKEPPGEQGYNVKWLLDAITKEHPKAQFIVCEGIAAFLPKGKTNDYHTVAKFLRDLSKFAKRTGKTFIGVHHTAKAKDEGYDNPREKLLGSAAWAGFAETIFVLDFFKSRDQENPYRKFHILPRNAPNQVKTMKQLGPEDGGRLIEVKGQDMLLDSSASALHTNSRRDGIEMVFQTFLRGIVLENGVKKVKVSQFEEALKDQLSRASIYRKINELEGRGILKRIAHGEYLVQDQSLADIFLA